MTKRNKAKVEATPAELASKKVRDDWTALCVALQKAGGSLPRGEVPEGLRYLLEERIRQVLFYALDPVREGELLRKRGKRKGLPVRRRKARVCLVRDWRFRLAAAGCDGFYDFQPIGDGGSPWL